MGKFTQAEIDLAVLAYPIFSNSEIADHIGCSIPWLEKLSQVRGLSKGPYCFTPGQSGYPHDLTGYRFGELTVESKGPCRSKKNVVWVCRCSCGKSHRVRVALLRQGRTTMCGHCANRIPERAKKKGEMGSWFWSKIKANAHERGIEVMVDCDHIVELFRRQDAKCALSGLPIEFPSVTRSGKTGTASLDRIRSNLPYQAGNLQWLHKDINMMKNKHDQDYFITLCRSVASQAEAHSP